MSRKLYDELGSLSDRHARLWSHFETFYRHSALLKKPDSPVRDAVISELMPERYFDVSFAGTTVRFMFTFRPGGPAGTKGTVTCYRLDLLRNEPSATIGEFHFDGQGDTGMKFPDNGDPVQITLDFGACYSIAYFLYEGLTKDS